jgi:hypothetical protein
MHWNHRVIDFTADYTANAGDPLFGFAEVYYNDDGTPSSYCSPFMDCDSLEELTQLVDRLAKALTQPVLKVEDFPEPQEEQA